MTQQPFSPRILARFLLCLPFFVMLFMMVIEASLHAPIPETRFGVFRM